MIVEIYVNYYKHFRNHFVGSFFYAFVFCHFFKNLFCGLCWSFYNHEKCGVREWRLFHTCKEQTDSSGCWGPLPFCWLSRTNELPERQPHNVNTHTHTKRLTKKRSREELKGHFENQKAKLNVVGTWFDTWISWLRFEFDY